MNDDASELDRPSSPVHIEIETQFFDQFAVLVPSAPMRQILLEHGVTRHLQRELAAKKQGNPIRALFDDGFGLLITEPLLGIPALLVAFEYEPPEDPSLVTLWRVRLAPAPEETED